MFNNLTYKQKFFAVIIGFVILFLAVYKKNIRHTLAAKKELNIVENQLANINQSHYMLFSLKEQVKNLDNIIGGNNLKPELVQSSILDFITKQNNEVNVVSIDDVHMYLDVEFKVYSNQIIVEGMFNNLVDLLYNIEKKYKESRVVSTKLYSKKNYQTKKTKLYLKIILQNYEKNK